MSSCLARAGSWSRLSLRPVHHAGQPAAEWWRDAVICQIYPATLRRHKRGKRSNN